MSKVISKQLSYPIVCRPSATTRVRMVFLGIAIALVGLLIFNQAHAPTVSTYLMMGLFCTGGLAFSTLTLAAKIMIYRDRIEQTTLFGTKSLERMDVQGYRTTQAKSSKILELVRDICKFKLETVVTAEHGATE